VKSFHLCLCLPVFRADACISPVIELIMTLLTILSIGLKGDTGDVGPQGKSTLT
jgi:hypothetical protein